MQEQIKQRSLFVVAGEASGDQLAAGVVLALKKSMPRLRVFGLGGPALKAAGAEVREDLTKQALIGFVEVLKHLPRVLERLSQCSRWLAQERPDAVLLTDYPGFNLRVAQKARELGIPVAYYVAPQAWAWHESRVHRMRRDIARLMVLFPFEEPWFRARGVDARYVGHPLARSVRPVKPGPMGDRPLICALPGSRKGEVERHWPVMLEASRLLRREFPKARFIVPRPPTFAPGDFPGVLPGDPITFVEPGDHRRRGACHLAWVKSGTSTLEQALLGTPMVILYKVAPLSALIARFVMTVKHVGIVNLLDEGPVAPELLQDAATPQALADTTRDLLRSPERRRVQTEAFRKIRRQLSHPPHASEYAARVVRDLLTGK